MTNAKNPEGLVTTIKNYLLFLSRKTVIKLYSKNDINQKIAAELQQVK